MQQCNNNLVTLASADLNDCTGSGLWYGSTGWSALVSGVTTLRSTSSSMNCHGDSFLIWWCRNCATSGAKYVPVSYFLGTET